MCLETVKLKLTQISEHFYSLVRIKINFDL